MGLARSRSWLKSSSANLSRHDFLNEVVGLSLESIFILSWTLRQGDTHKTTIGVRKVSNPGYEFFVFGAFFYNITFYLIFIRYYISKFCFILCFRPFML